MLANDSASSPQFSQALGTEHPSEESKGEIVAADRGH